MARALLLSLAVLAALGVAGCSGGDSRLSKTEYEEKVRAVYAEVQEAFLQTNVPLEELPDRIGDAQAELRDAADELDDVQPPADVEAENDQIVEGLRAYADDLDGLRTAAEQGDEQTVSDFNSRVSQNRSLKLVAEAAEKMRFKGYDLGPIAEE